jgi:hypothetical protein
MSSISNFYDWDVCGCKGGGGLKREERHKKANSFISTGIATDSGKIAYMPFLI